MQINKQKQQKKKKSR